MQWLYLDANQQQVSAEEEQLGELFQAGHIQADTMLWNETMSDWQTAQSIWPDSFQAEASAAATVPRPHPPSGPPMIKRRGSKPATKSPRTGAPTRKPSTKPKPKPLTTGGGAKTKRAAQKKEEEAENGEIVAVTRRFGNHLANQAGWMMAVAAMSMVLGSVAVLAGVVAIIGKPHFLPVVPIVLGVIPIGVSFLLMKAAGASKLAVSSGSPENLDNSLEQLGKYFVGIGIFLLIMLVLILAVIGLAIFSPGLFLSLG